MLLVTAYERLGYMPHGVVHGYVDQQPIMKWVTDSLGFVTGRGRGGAAANRAAPPRHRWVETGTRSSALGAEAPS